MDKGTFASYKFKPSDVIEGLNRYFAETKANRYRRVPLEIRNGVCYNNPDCVKDIMFTNSIPERATKSGWRCWNHYIICDPEEVVGVAINWLREEHDIFYTPGMEVPRENCDIFCEENLDVVPVAKVRDALGIAEDSDIFQCVKDRNHLLETLRIELVEARRMYHNSIKERNKFGRRLMDIRRAAGMTDGDQTDLVEYVKALREGKEQYEQLYKGYEKLREDKDLLEELHTNHISQLNDYAKLAFELGIESGDAESIKDYIISLKKERDELKEKYDRLYISYEKTYRAKFNALSAERDRYKWLYENLRDGMESVLQEAEERED